MRKIESNHSKSPNFIRSKSTLNKQFGVQHFCGSVNYSIKGFCEKNRDRNNEAWINGLINSSESRFLQRIFDKSLMIRDLESLDNPTIGSQFRNSLESLLKELEKREPLFVLCLRPNDWKKSMVIFF